ncbi:hypothetical protein [Haloferula sp. A504]|uniref:hypothetical protein n=1 Tax=Haloferula sp. A504 TaxID=3373601 RepID=UPI0031CA0965|nr:hypothetical protein [Verrucomicrobiaceae bacterium E54]
MELQGGKRPENTRLQSGRRQSAIRLQSARNESSARSVGRVIPGDTAAGNARRGLSEASLQGAATRIPKSRIGELLFDVAGELEGMEVDMREEAVGYYMAALADPEGDRYEEAKRRLRRIFLYGGLPHEEAARLYEGGWSIFTELSEPRIGLDREGLASARRDLRELRAEYHRQRLRGR